LSRTPKPPERDARGRILPGHSGNPKGRPPVGKYAKLFAAAAELGAVVVLMPQAAVETAEPADGAPPTVA
jgi:hypothetical protein